MAYSFWAAVVATPLDVGYADNQYIFMAADD